MFEKLSFNPTISRSLLISPIPDHSILHWKSSHLPQGLKNVGNTCFLNSTLQCLLHTPPIQNFPHLCSKHFCVLCSLKKLYNTHPEVPKDFLSSIPHLSQQFQIGRQADAHELLRFLVNKIDSKDFKSQVFAGELQSIVRCKECLYESRVNEVFLDLSLEVGSGILEKCLSDFCKEEDLSDENKYSCPGCKKKTNASKRYLIKSSPSVLMIQLKRFMNDGRKDNRIVEFRERLVIERETMSKKKVEYKLYAVLVHVGFGSRNGHYFSYVKAGNEGWFEVNDSHVIKASVDKILGHHGAYILMYIKDVPKDTDFKRLKHPTKAPTCSKRLKTEKLEEKLRKRRPKLCNNIM